MSCAVFSPLLAATRSNFAFNLSSSQIEYRFMVAVCQMYIRSSSEIFRALYSSTLDWPPRGRGLPREHVALRVNPLIRTGEADCLAGKAERRVFFSRGLGDVNRFPGFSMSGRRARQ